VKLRHLYIQFDGAAFGINGRIDLSSITRCHVTRLKESQCGQPGLFTLTLICRIQRRKSNNCRIVNNIVRMTLIRIVVNFVHHADFNRHTRKGGDFLAFEYPAISLSRTQIANSVTCRDSFRLDSYCEPILFLTGGTLTSSEQHCPYACGPQLILFPSPCSWSQYCVGSCFPTIPTFDTWKTSFVAGWKGHKTFTRTGIRCIRDMPQDPKHEQKRHTDITWLYPELSEKASIQYGRNHTKRPAVSQKNNTLL
jgi:hypothetical protein